jgi:hypothetical protein
LARLWLEIIDGSATAGRLCIGDEALLFVFWCLFASFAVVSFSPRRCGEIWLNWDD